MQDVLREMGAILILVGTIIFAAILTALIVAARWAVCYWFGHISGAVC